MKVFDVHDRQLDILKPHLLEASAGTGKTYSIQHIATRLLLTGSIKIEQILIVTFTRAATRELKDRIRLNIEKALTSLQKESAVEDYLMEVLEKGPQETASACAYLREALVCFDNAQIFTIHAFCQKMLSEFAFEGEIAFRKESSLALPRAEILKRSVADALRADMPDEAFTAFQTRHFLSKKFSLGSLAKALEKEIVGDKLVVFPLKDALEKIPLLVSPFSSDQFLADFAVLRKCYNGLKGDFIDRQVASLARIMAQKTCTKEDLEDLIEGKSFFLDPLLDPECLRAKARHPESLNNPDLFPLLKQEVLPLVTRMRDPSLVAQHILIAAKKHFEKWSLGLSFDALITAMHTAVMKPAFKEKVQARYSAVVIDEFQDTDAMQWEIFSLLFREGPQVIYLVGDPKQSIYGFRDADIYTYLKAPQEIPTMQRACLNTNYRSQPSLMQALNRLFASAQWLNLPKTQTFLDYEEVLPSQKEDAHLFHDGLGSLHFMLVEESPSPRGRFPSSETELNLLFPNIAHKILRLCSDEGIRCENIAVLVKDRYQARNLQSYLSSRGIASVLKRPKTLKEALSLGSLQDIFKALEDPNSLPLLKQVLLSPVWGHALADLQGEWENIYLQESRLLFTDLREVFLEQGFFVCLERLLRSEWQGRSVLRMLIENDQEEIFHEWRQIADLLSAHCVHQLTTFSGTISALEEIKTSQDEDSKGLYAVHRHVDAVTLMTSHMSKGLEFEIVFALGLCQRNVRYKGETVEESEEEMALSSEETQAEKLRLFYVALTRAKKRVYLFAVLQSAETPIPLEKASPVELYFSKIFGADRVNFATVLQWIDQASKGYKISSEVLQIRDAQENLNAKDVKNLLTLEFTRFPWPQSRKTLSFSSLAHAYKIQDEEPYEKTEPSSLLPVGSETGQLVHGILEKVFKLHLYNPFNPQAIQALILKEIKDTPFFAFEEPLSNMVLQALQTTILPSFALTDLEKGEFFCETEFLFSWKEHCIKGVADLVFRHQGKIYLLDWKTNDLGPGAECYSPEKLDLAMKKNGYYFQASLYEEALRRYVKQFDNRPFEEIFGGALYFFLRGNTCLHFSPASLLDFLPS